MKEKSIENLFEINILNFIYLVGKLENNLAAGSGIHALSSTVSLYGNGFNPVYSAMKAALNGFILSLQRYFSEKNKFAYSLCMCATNTKMRGRIFHDGAA